MPGWLTDLQTALGFTTPFIFAAATYSFFHWLDKRASDPAKRAISGWLRPKEYDRAAVQTAVVELFDHVYTYPLFTLRAFRRSAFITISIIVIIILLYDLPLVIFLFASDMLDYIGISLIASSLMVNSMSNYIALFIVRRILIKSHITPLVALMIGPGLGVLAVVFGIFIRACALDEIDTLILDRSSGGQSPWWPDFYEVFALTIIGLVGTDTIGALLVHLWLTFFALSIGVIKGLNYFLLVTKQIQWFIKPGKEHPLDVLGFVAAPLIFIVAAVVQVLVSE